MSSSRFEHQERSIRRPRQVWSHPISNVPLPQCAKAVVLDDLARKTTLSGESRAKVSHTVHFLVKKAVLTETSLKEELQRLEALLAQRMFRDMPPGWGTPHERVIVCWVQLFLPLPDSMACGRAVESDLFWWLWNHWPTGRRTIQCLHACMLFSTKALSIAVISSFPVFSRSLLPFS